MSSHGIEGMTPEQYRKMKILRKNKKEAKQKRK